MPGGNGDEVLAYLRKMKCDTSFIYFSGNADLLVENEPPLIYTIKNKNFNDLFSFLSEKFSSAKKE